MACQYSLEQNGKLNNKSWHSIRKTRYMLTLSISPKILTDDCGTYVHSSSILLPSGRGA